MELYTVNSTKIGAPISAQVKSEISTLKPSWHLTPVDPPSRALAGMLAVPSCWSGTVTFWHTATGAKTPSWIITVTLQLDSLPLKSVAVRMTVFSPILEQSKEVISADLVSIAQLSDQPANSSLSVRVTCKSSSRETVMSWQSIKGAVVSSMVTIALQDDTLPWGSVMVNTTLFCPMLLQSKVSTLTDVVKFEQLSELPWSKSSGVIVASPFSSSTKVTLWQRAVG